MAFRHFTTRTSLQPQGIRARRNVQVHGRLLGMRRPCVFLINDPTFPPYLLLAAQRSALSIRLHEVRSFGHPRRTRSPSTTKDAPSSRTGHQAIVYSYPKQPSCIPTERARLACLMPNASSLIIYPGPSSLTPPQSYPSHSYLMGIGTWACAISPSIPLPYATQWLQSPDTISPVGKHLSSSIIHTCSNLH